MTLPEPDTHCFDEDTQTDCWSYSKELVEKIVAEAEAAILAKIGEPVAYQWLNTMHVREKIPSYVKRNHEWWPLYRLPEVKK